MAERHPTEEQERARQDTTADAPRLAGGGDPATPDETGGAARVRRPVDEAAGGADSSPLETVPSGEKAEAMEGQSGQG